MAVSGAQEAGSQPQNLFPIKLPPTDQKPFTPVRRPPGPRVWNGGGMVDAFGGGKVDELFCKANPPELWESLLAGGRGGVEVKDAMPSQQLPLQGRGIDWSLRLPTLSERRASQLNRHNQSFVRTVGMCAILVLVGAAMLVGA